jgi:glutamate-ammonia-ligase adenylyltransferase
MGKDAVTVTQGIHLGRPVTRASLRNKGVLIMTESGLASSSFSQYIARWISARPELASRLGQMSAQPIGRAAMEARLGQLLAGPAGNTLVLSQQATGLPAEAAATLLPVSSAVLLPALRYLRLEVFGAVMERDLRGWADVAEVTSTMTDLAEIAIRRSLQVLEAELQASFGAPLNGLKQPLTMGVVGMGKLGGRELNVSSDIDLIFLYEDDGETAGGTRPALSNQEYFTRLARRLIGALSEMTADGYVFRVDMRLRPNGDSGPLVCSLGMLEEYFYVQGREWERYAWIKGRLVSATDNAAGARLSDALEAMVRPFVYRRYLDYGAIESIRSLHLQIRQEAERRASMRPDKAEDVKLGRGGIREIEFAAQVFQLIRGGQDAGLRARPTLQVLSYAAAGQWLDAAVAQRLAAAYDLLRRVEHRLQYMNDAQTHALPVEAEPRERLALSLGFVDYETFLTELNRHREVVQRQFDRIFADKVGAGLSVADADDRASPSENRVAGNASGRVEADSSKGANGDATDAKLNSSLTPTQISQTSQTSPTSGISPMPPNSITQPVAPVDPGAIAARDRNDAAWIWSGALAEESSAAEVCERLMALGFAAPTELLTRLRTVWNSGRYAELNDRNRQRFDWLVQQALGSLRRFEPAAHRDVVLLRWLEMLEAIGRRGAYLALLTEFPKASARVLAVLNASRWAADYLIRHPQLLDELLDDEALAVPFDWDAFKAGLQVRLAASEGTEQSMDLLRHAHHAEVFRILLRDLDGHMSVEHVSDRLSELADAMLELTLSAVWRQLPQRHREQPQFAVIAYGKLGGKELGYSSDLDLIFLYDDPDERAAEVYAVFARRLISWLTTATGAGTLFDIDLRLRPNGVSGLLVTSLESFRQYELREGGAANSAWVWEHQALTRGRHAAGDARIGAAFEAIRVQVLTTPREAIPLASEVVAMRQRAYEGHPNRSTWFDLKHDRGGMVDIEFTVQYLVLLHAARLPELVRNTGNIALLRETAHVGLMTELEAETVGAAYRTYRSLQHRLRLDGVDRPRVPVEQVSAERDAVLALWQRVFAIAVQPLTNLK